MLGGRRFPLLSSTLLERNKMGLENLDVIDAAGLEASTGTVVLSILDSQDWMDERGHLLALQAKMNSYFGFIESGQIYEDYPDAKMSKLRIDVIGRYPLPPTATRLIEKANEVATALSIEVVAKILPSS